MLNVSVRVCVLTLLTVGENAGIYQKSQSSTAGAGTNINKKVLNLCIVQSTTP